MAKIAVDIEDETVLFLEGGLTGAAEDLGVTLHRYQELKKARDDAARFNRKTSSENFSLKVFLEDGKPYIFFASTDSTFSGGVEVPFDTITEANQAELLRRTALDVAKGGSKRD